jgi:hypothetical protein
LRVEPNSDSRRPELMPMREGGADESDQPWTCLKRSHEGRGGPGKQPAAVVVRRRPETEEAVSSKKG